MVVKCGLVIVPLWWGRGAEQREVAHGLRHDLTGLSQRAQWADFQLPWSMEAGEGLRREGLVVELRWSIGRARGSRVVEQAGWAKKIKRGWS